MLQIVGYSLIDDSNNEVQYWGNSPGIFPSCPDRITLPTGIIVEGVIPYTELFDGYNIVERWIEASPTTEIDTKIGESIEFRTDKIVVVYEYSLPELEVFQNFIKSKVATKRWEAETTGVVINENHFATDRESQSKYTAIEVAITHADPLTWSINWKTSNGTFITLNAEEMMVIIDDIEQYIQDCFNKEYELQQQIDACTTLEQVMAIDYNTGWPSDNIS